MVTIVTIVAIVAIVAIVIVVPFMTMLRSTPLRNKTAHVQNPVFDCVSHSDSHRHIHA